MTIKSFLISNKRITENIRIIPSSKHDIYEPVFLPNPSVLLITYIHGCTIPKFTSHTLIPLTAYFLKTIVTYSYASRKTNTN